MTLEETKPNGYELWICPTCGRTVLIQWKPWDKIVLTVGDPNAQHSGSKGGLMLDGLKVDQDDRLPPEIEDWLRGKG
jgi:hypothetical protein